MPKEEWGVKRLCPTTGKRFYDMNRNPIVSPYTGEAVALDTGKGRIIERAHPGQGILERRGDPVAVGGVHIRQKRGQLGQCFQCQFHMPLRAFRAPHLGPARARPIERA